MKILQNQILMTSLIPWRQFASNRMDMGSFATSSRTNLTAILE